MSTMILFHYVLDKYFYFKIKIIEDIIYNFNDFGVYTISSIREGTNSNVLQ